MTTHETSPDSLKPTRYPSAWCYVGFRVFGAPFYLGMLFFGLVEPITERVFGKAAVRLSRRSLSALSRGFIRLNGLRIEAAGSPMSPDGDGRPRVVMATHKGRLDGYILYAMFPFRFKMFWSTTSHVLNEGFRSVVWASRRLDLFFTHDKSNRRITLREFRRAEVWVREGNTLAFFPEGTNTPEHELAELGRACVNLAIRSGAEIQPVIISGSSHGFEDKTGSLFRPATARVEFMPPFSADTADAEALHQRLRQALLDGLARQRVTAGEG
jgi:1-acyl-sn-glycerol-3-phosphate acyltransferase